MVAIVFYIFSFFLLSSAFAVVFARNPVHAVLFLILGFFNAAGLFILCGAEFLAMLLVIVYVGAVAVLFLFVVMMLNISPSREKLWFTSRRWLTLKKGLKDGGVYITLWLPCFTILSIILIWLALPGSDLNPVKLLVDLASRPFETLTFINNSSSTFLIPALLVLVSGLAAGKITSSLTKVSLFRVCEFLVKGLPAPLMTGMILTLEFIVMLVYWSPGGLHEKERLAVQGLVNNTAKATHALAELIYINYALAFLMAGLILLVAMIGAIVLTLHKRTDAKRQNIARQLSRRKENTLEIRKVKTGEGI